MVAQEYRDECRTVARYLNDLAEHDPERGISVWLIDARAVRIGDSPWAPLFDVVVEPNEFTATVEKARQNERPTGLEALYSEFTSADFREAARIVVERWIAKGHRRRIGLGHVVLEARGPGGGRRANVVLITIEGHVAVPFGAYEGQNSGIEAVDLMTPEFFRRAADVLFGFKGREKQAQAVAGWPTTERTEELLNFCERVADAYSAPAQKEDFLDGCSAV